MKWAGVLLCIVPSALYAAVVEPVRGIVHICGLSQTIQTIVPYRARKWC